MKQHIRFLVIVFCVLVTSAYGADNDTLVAAIKKGSDAEIASLLANGTDINAKDSNGWTPMHTAAYAGRKDIAALLLAKGADINARTKNDGGTPLYWVVLNGEKAEDMARWLLANGADANVKTFKGMTPLSNTEMHAKKDIAVLLLSKGANVNTEINFRNPIDWALSVHDVAMHKREIHVAEKLEEYMLKQARGNPLPALVPLTSQLKNKPDNKNIRSLIIKLAGEIKPAPAVPEEARKHFVEGSAIVKAAKNPAQQSLAAQSFSEALKVAPWWSDAYYNLGVAQELAEKYDAAEQAFNFYLLSNPSDKEKREVQDRIYGLSAKRKLSGAK
ncbi:MAG: hypothetical protein A3I66_20765 [Burkholderiales bacterium RIFCSPLOWO2_02_FULL_57_36]|nr:MAG: hypothetical protein A3I66_20765 [Burkholderiales bacterium RIFCSPLOWO2_02_FULL_57_36]